jgi:hypothetical protein
MIRPARPTLAEVPLADLSFGADEGQGGDRERLVDGRGARDRHLGPLHRLQRSAQRPDPERGEDACTGCAGECRVPGSDSQPLVCQRSRRGRHGAAEEPIRTGRSAGAGQHSGGGCRCGDLVDRWCRNDDGRTAVARFGHASREGAVWETAQSLEFHRSRWSWMHLEDTLGSDGILEDTTWQSAWRSSVAGPRA